MRESPKYYSYGAPGSVMRVRLNSITFGDDGFPKVAKVSFYSRQGAGFAWLISEIEHNRRIKKIQPHGHWIITPLDNYRIGGYRQSCQCSECKSIMYSDPTESNDAREYQYCPYCGACLDGLEEWKKYKKPKKSEVK